MFERANDVVEVRVGKDSERGCPAAKQGGGYSTEDSSLEEEQEMPPKAPDHAHHPGMPFAFLFVLGASHSNLLYHLAHPLVLSTPLHHMVLLFMPPLRSSKNSVVPRSSSFSSASASRFASVYLYSNPTLVFSPIALSVSHHADKKWRRQRANGYSDRIGKKWMVRYVSERIVSRRPRSAGPDERESEVLIEENASAAYQERGVQGERAAEERARTEREQQSLGAETAVKTRR